jgi:CRP-like cAMP-binding protein
MYSALPPIFAGMRPEVSAEASAFMTQASFDAGDVVMLEGEDDHSLAFILSGNVELSANGASLGHAVTRDVIGEVELFAQCPRLATVTATTPVELLVLDQAGFQELLESGNPVVYALERNVIRRLGERIRGMNEKISESGEGHPIGLHQTQKSVIQRMLSPFARSPAGPTIAPVEVLRKSELFNWAPDDALVDIAGVFEAIAFAADEVICRQGEAGDKMYIIASGAVEVLLELQADRAEVVATLAAGHAFGDSSIALGTPRAASCIARGAVTAITTDRGRFLELYGLDAPVGSVFRQAIVRNLILQLMAATDKLLALHAAAEMSGNPMGGVVSPNATSKVWRD